MATLISSNVPTRSIDLKADSTINVNVISNLSSRTSSSASDDSEIILSSVASEDTASARLDSKKDGYTTYYPHPTTFKLGDHPIDEIRPLKVSREYHIAPQY